MTKQKKILIINTGGTIGMVHEDNNPLNPLKPGNWDEITENYPVLKQLKDRNVETAIYTFTPLLDSSNISHENWKQMAQVISEQYHEYDGFVILHGTDTMCYTAAALSFMLEHLGKPVILTGSQLPLASPRHDALENFITALSIAAGIDVNDGSAVTVVPEVCILFRGKLLRGNRSRKLSASAYAGFESPNYPPLGTVGEHIVLDTRLIRSGDNEEFFANTELATNIKTHYLTPLTTPDALKRELSEIRVDSDRNATKALVLQTYGTGNTQNNKDFLDAVQSLVEDGILVVDVTQCPQGMVELGLYEASAPLLDRGVISGLDMTPEAALCKLMWLLGMGWDLEQVVKQMQLDQRGEQSLNIFNIDYGAGTASPVFSGQQLIPGEVEFEKLESAVLQVRGVQVNSPLDAELEVFLRVYVNYQNLQPDTGMDVIQYAGACKTVIQGGGKNSLFLDVTNATKKFFTKGRPGRVGIVSANGEDISFEKLNIALYVRV